MGNSGIIVANHKRLPRRIILSRKGWDNTSGGKPSPILEDGTLMSIPIPDCASKIRYEDLRLPDGRGLGNLVESLTKGKVLRTSEVHLDPDIRKDIIERSGDFTPAFGQSGNSQSQLENSGLCKKNAEEDADLFLFFGLYRQVKKISEEEWRYEDPRSPNAASVHVIWGWLQIGEILLLREEEAPSNLKTHPHAIPSFIVEQELKTRSKNALYIPRDVLTFLDKPGYGVFKAPFHPNDETDPRQLTKPGQPLTPQWRIPSFFRKLSNMGKEKQREPDGAFWEPHRRGRGQEFVLDIKDQETEIRRWLTWLFTKCEAEAHS